MAYRQTHLFRGRRHRFQACIGSMASRGEPLCGMYGTCRVRVKKHAQHDLFDNWDPNCQYHGTHGHSRVLNPGLGVPQIFRQNFHFATQKLAKGPCCECIKSCALFAHTFARRAIPFFFFFTAREKRWRYSITRHLLKKVATFPRRGTSLVNESSL